MVALSWWAEYMHTPNAVATAIASHWRTTATGAANSLSCRMGPGRARNVVCRLTHAAGPGGRLRAVRGLLRWTY